MFSSDAGQTWRALRLNLPTVAVHDLVVKGNDLVVGTHGRSIWIFDDLTPVREWSPKLAATNVHLFQPTEAIRWRYHSGPREKNSGENPPRGAAMYLWLKEKPKGEVKLEILDARDRVVRTLSSTAPEAWGASEDEDEPKAPIKAEDGLQRIVWDLRWEGATLIKNAKIDTGNPAQGPLAVPGTYKLRLTVDGAQSTSQLLVKPDPRVRLTQADLETNQAFALEIRDAITRLGTDVNRVKAVRDQLQARNKALEGDPRAKEIISMSKALIERLDKVEAQMHNPTAEVVYDILAQKGGAQLYSRLSPLLAFVDEGDGVPTQGMRDVFAMQQKELAALESQLKGLLDSDLTAIQLGAKRLDIPFIVIR